MQRRNQQASAAMISKLWTRQMGFMTGMLMALIGSAFILGRLEVREARLSAEGGGVPGIGATERRRSRPRPRDLSSRRWEPC